MNQITTSPGGTERRTIHCIDMLPLPYLRSQPMSFADQRDLDAYCEVLRHFYDIPAGMPVFPARTAAERADRSPLAPTQPRAAGRNDRNHPWRTS
jgi:hypothetical protein